MKTAIDEKQEAVVLWDSIVSLSKLVISSHPEDDRYIRVSSLYGLYLHRIIASGWEIMALGFEGDQTGNYNKVRIRQAIKEYDKAWLQYQGLKKQEPSCATLYKPYAFIFVGPDYFAQKGMDFSINKYRNL